MPAHVQTRASDAFADFVVSHAMEVTDANGASYQLSAKRPDAAMKITVRGDGTMVGYSAKFRPPEK